MASLSGRWEDWGLSVGDDEADYSGVDGVRLYVNLHEEEDLSGPVGWCRERGLRVILCLDYHVPVPYHGRPPHVDVEGRIVKTPAGYGYTPFGWGEGWLWVEEKVRGILADLDPDGVQWAEDPHIRNGWGFATKPEYHYNDEFTIFHRAAMNAGWRGFVVIPDTPGSVVQRRGISRARKTVDVEGQVLLGFDDVYRESDVTFVGVFAEEDEGPEEWEERDLGGNTKRRLIRIENQLMRVEDECLRIIGSLEDITDFLDIER